MKSIDLREAYKGSFVGLTIGDTLGMPVEFKQAGSFEPVTKPEEGGSFNLPLGYWTDDTSMALCLADSIIDLSGYDSFSVMDLYYAWREKGYRSSTGVCFDIGTQTSSSLDDYKKDGSAIVSADKQRISSAGNGSIMRLAPVVIAAHATRHSLESIMEIARISARETHYSYLAEEGTALFGALLANAFTAESKEEIFTYGTYSRTAEFDEVALAIKEAQTIDRGMLVPSGYIVDSLMCATWAFIHHDSFEEGALAAVNLGGDADTIGAIYGQLAGAYYGYNAIPHTWRAVLHQEEDITLLADTLAELSTFDVLRTRFDEDGELYHTEYEITVLEGDITKLHVDAIVNAANTKLLGGGGVCGAIFNAAGFDDMTAACTAIGGCEYGEAVVTHGFMLPASWVIHTVGPIYGQHDGAEPDILKSCYWESLRKAQDKALKTIAFPLISTGIYGYPTKEAIDISIEAIREFFEDNPHSSIQTVVLCAFTPSDARLLSQAIDT